uniref:C2H2-type domain-containing protein n=1 Tax=Ganoderma boninense TaxID=34458 RepID=A0A5K1JVL2_9APHY|nr:C2H2-type domain-containing protein [Ganoderma boninense]
MKLSPFVSGSVLLLTLRFARGIVIDQRDCDKGGSNTSTIQWSPCDPSIVADSSLSCGFFEIPIDYHNSAAGKGRIAVIKANATHERRGTYFMNPGGPGASGLQALGSIPTASYLLNVTGGLYDIVSWDPRGVGSLSIVGEYDAFFNGTIELSGIEMTGNFTDQSDIDALLAQADSMQKKYVELGKKCQEHSDGKYLKYIGTAATVRDLVALNDALDGPEAPINYYGYSYGTILGSWLVNMFPDRVGRVVLDGVLDPQLFGSVELSLGWQHQLKNADDVYYGLVTGCALAGSAGCAITSEGQTPADVDNTIQTVLSMAHDAARKNSSVPLTSGQLRTALYSYMYWPTRWANLTNSVFPEVFQIVKGESQGNSNVTKRSSPFSRSLVKRAENDTTPYTTSAILCGDGKDLGNVTMTDIFNGIISASQNISHMSYICSLWPERAIERYEGPFNKTLANPILVLGNTYDPITPFSGAQALAEELGDSAKLVRMNGFGHTTSAANGASTCINGVLLAYTVNGTLPEDNNMVCEVDDDFEIWPGVSTNMILENMTASGAEAEIKCFRHPTPDARRAVKVPPFLP